jgi:hypothetical protein
MRRLPKDDLRDVYRQDRLPGRRRVPSGREPEVNDAKKCWCGGRIVYGRGDHGEDLCADSGFHDPHATGKLERIDKLYVAGPMSGYPDCNYPAFNEAAEALRSLGYEVINPAEFGEGRHYVDFIREDLRLMLDCHGVATLEGWWESVGARNEVSVAGILKMPVRSVADWAGRKMFEPKMSSSYHH